MVTTIKIQRQSKGQHALKLRSKMKFNLHFGLQLTNYILREESKFF